MGRFERISIVGVILLSLGAEARAADMFGQPAMQAPDFSGVRTEYGTGWYLRGSVNVSQDKTPQFSADVPMAKSSFGGGVEFGVGYQLNKRFRADVTGNWNANRTAALSGSNVTCPYQLTGLTSQPPPGGTPYLLGYLWDPSKETCRPDQTSRLSKVDLLLNGYVDLGTWSGVTPYVGAGIGVSSLGTFTDLNYYKTSDGTLYNANLTPTGAYPHLWVNTGGVPYDPQPVVAFAPQNWSRVVRKTFTNLTWALMAGLSYDISSNAKLDIGYRYMNSGSLTSLPSPVTGLTKTSKLTSQEVRFGVRYMID